MAMQALLMLGLASHAFAAPVSDAVLSLPGWPGQLPTRHYSGYLEASSTKKLHYYMVQSAGDVSKDPVVLWFNGGPGCSSLDGFLYEHGPFRVEYDGSGNAKLNKFDYAWNQLATMVYIEAPVGVGFSYSSAADTLADYACDDDTAALDNVAAVESLFKKFPEFSKHDLFITGESYAGIYVPTLAEAILQKGDNYTGAPLKGIAVGNGCSGDEIGICAFGKNTQGRSYTTKYFLSSGFIPDSLKADVDSACDWSAFSKGLAISPACDAKVSQVEALTELLDTYCVYCECPVTSNAANEAFLDSKAGGQMLLSEKLGTTPCVNTFEASAWLNNPDVRKAIHVEPANVENWQVCGSADGWTYKSTRPNLPRDTYPLLVSKISVLIYNGDFDACVPYTDNEAWTRSMGYNITKDWHPWVYQDGAYKQIGGYATSYDVPGGSFTFTTVRGGRHEARRPRR
ncbi:peptidase S10, serine carboxypeptidase [Pelagophyceae sp. CCMP2097]|nr:peptidase S10, serine carboxypeptidase [Pelagophyceae sp. CCMP2097]